MPTVNLTARKVESLKSTPGRRIEYWDRSLPGFGLRVTSNGKKSWVLLYRHHRRLRRYTLGHYPATTLASARDRARRALDRVSQGVDPATEAKRERHDGKLFPEFADDYMQRHAKVNKKSWRDDEWMIRRFLKPRWKTVPVRDIQRQDVQSLIDSIAGGGAGVLANRVLALVGKMFNFGIAREWVNSNPCQHIDKAVREVPRDRVLSPDEMRRVWHAIQAEDTFFRTYFQLRLLTAQRGSEVRQMRWCDVDLEAGSWSIPKEFSKNEMSHVVPLSTPALDLLRSFQAWQRDELRRINMGRAKKRWEARKPSPWVFASSKNGEHIQWVQRVTQRLRVRSGVDFRPHDLRRTAATVMTAHGVTRFILQRVLNHTDESVTAVYDRFTYDLEKRKALEDWATLVEKIVRSQEVLSNVSWMTANLRAS